MLLFLVRESNSTKKRTKMALGYDEEKGEYVCLHNGKEIWREKGDTDLLNEFYKPTCPNYDALIDYRTYKRFDETCEQVVKWWNTVAYLQPFSFTSSVRAICFLCPRKK